MLQRSANESALHPAPFSVLTLNHTANTALIKIRGPQSGYTIASRIGLYPPGYTTSTNFGTRGRRRSLTSS